MSEVREEELIKAFSEMGFNKRSSKKLARLIRYLMGEIELTGYEMKRWREVGALDEEGRIVGSEEELKDPVYWILLGLAWEGLVKVVVR